ncbi:hypothetical protein FOXB_15340 [Fusarium oxysporum f. sp. conglutinans Fo5176]|uniref:Uncharacterized protein n=1 Tax=Fusarium oxysporum (strain Fo5176) TaxID=660025 RepID=F9G9K8_FUSOF|nr:hypothetical protein FOXB_15340 [Fusarium oxysporum f. sp. conglutinans Fo5176]
MSAGSALMDAKAKPSASRLGDAMPLSKVTRGTVPIRFKGELALNTYNCWLWLAEVKSKAF